MITINNHNHRMLTVEHQTVTTERALVTPNTLIQSLPTPPKRSDTIAFYRKQTADIIHGDDPRLLVVVGPCSIHDPDAAIEYALKLKQLANDLQDKLLIIMRVYFEKPRTTIGWKGLIRDPHLDQTYDINQGLRIARQLLLAINELGLPCATEFLDAMIPTYLQDLITWSAIGARTVQSQMHRELASGLLMPVGFKNNTDGNINVAIDALQTAQHPHQFVSINQQGQPAIIETQGNANGHIILRGANDSTNFSAESIHYATQQLIHAKMTPRVMIDCSHGNSMKDYQKQPEVLASLAEMIQQGSTSILGVMLESNLVAGKQKLISKNRLVYGQSITDGCIGWEETQLALVKLASYIDLKTNSNLSINQ